MTAAKPTEIERLIELLAAREEREARWAAEQEERAKKFEERLHEARPPDVECERRVRSARTAVLAALLLLIGAMIALLGKSR